MQAYNMMQRLMYIYRLAIYKVQMLISINTLMGYMHLMHDK